MNLLSGRRPRIRLVGAMIGIAAVGLGLGGAAWVRSAWPEVEARRQAAAACASRARYWRQVAGWIDDPRLRIWRSPNSPGTYDDTDGGQAFDQRWPHAYTLALDSVPQGEDQREFVRRHRGEILALCRARVAHHERMSGRWSAAAWTPWTDPGPDAPVPPIVTRAVDQSY